MNSESLDRWLKLEGLENIRDVGGLPLDSGGTTRPGVLLRSASLRYVTEADVAHLVDVVGLRLVLDLRTAREIERDGPTAVATAGVETVALSFIPEDGRALPETRGDSADGRSADATQRDPLLHSYLGYLVDRTENVVEAVRRLGAEGAGPALVHCAAGKDRTGVLVALVLDVVGVRREAVVADYALSAERVEALCRRWAAEEGVEMPADLSVHLPRAEVISAVLARLDVEHGAGGSNGAAGWLLANGLDTESLHRLRQRLT